MKKIISLVAALLMAGTFVFAASLDSQRETNRSNGLGYITDAERNAQIKTNSKKGYGELTDYQIQETLFYTDFEFDLTDMEKKGEIQNGYLVANGKSEIKIKCTGTFFSKLDKSKIVLMDYDTNKIYPSQLKILDDSEMVFTIKCPEKSSRIYTYFQQWDVECPMFLFPCVEKSDVLISGLSIDGKNLSKNSQSTLLVKGLNLDKAKDFYLYLDNEKTSFNVVSKSSTEMKITFVPKKIGKTLVTVSAFPKDEAKNDFQFPNGKKSSSKYNGLVFDKSGSYGPFINSDYSYRRSPVYCIMLWPTDDNIDVKKFNLSDMAKNLKVMDGNGVDLGAVPSFMNPYDDVKELVLTFKGPMTKTDLVLYDSSAKVVLDRHEINVVESPMIFSSYFDVESGNNSSSSSKLTVNDIPKWIRDAECVYFNICYGKRIWVKDFLNKLDSGTKIQSVEIEKDSETGFHILKLKYVWHEDGYLDQKINIDFVINENTGYAYPSVVDINLNNGATKIRRTTKDSSDTDGMVDCMGSLYRYDRYFFTITY